MTPGTQVLFRRATLTHLWQEWQGQIGKDACEDESGLIFVRSPGELLQQVKKRRRFLGDRRRQVVQIGSDIGGIPCCPCRLDQ
jgi:hypothetical protein